MSRQSTKTDSDGEAPALARQSGDDPETSGEPLKPMPEPALIAQLDRAIELLQKFSTLRRYGSEGSAIKEVCEILQSVKEKL